MTIIGPWMFIDIAFNATDKQFENNLDEIMKSATSNNVIPIFVGLDVESSLKCISLAQKYGTACYFGVHPLHLAGEQSFEDFKTSYEKCLISAKDSPGFERVVALGECGLDYFRANNKMEQKNIFRAQISLASIHEINLPFFLHCRQAHADFIKEVDGIRGVVHSFDGTIEEAINLIDRGFYIGINGCSMRTKENVEVVKQLPIERILLETDSPYCLIRNSYHASQFIPELKKAKRNEPSLIIQNALALARIKQLSLEEVERICFENTLKAFPKLKGVLNLPNTTEHA